MVKWKNVLLIVFFVKQFHITTAQDVSPRFALNASATVRSLNRTSATLVFHTWNTNNNRTVAPTTYLLTLNDEEIGRFGHAQSGKITIRINELVPNKSYDYELTCWAESIQCLGKSIKGRFTTLSCPAPSRLDHIVRTFDSEEKYRQLRVDFLSSEDNCVGKPKLRVTIKTDGEVWYNRTGEFHFISNIPRDIDFLITGSITNSAGKTKYFEEHVSATSEIPAEPVLKSFDINSTCIHIQVSNEDDLLFKKLLFKFTCTYGEVVKKSSINAPQTQKASQVLCGFTTNSGGSCEVTVENNIGMSEALIASSPPKCVTEARTLGRTPEATTTEKVVDVNLGVIAVFATAAVIGVLLVAGLIILRTCFWLKINSAQVNQLPARKSLKRERNNILQNSK